MSNALPERWVFRAAALLLFAAATFTRADADLWGHLRFGLDILRDFKIPSVDPYSFTQDTPWINHEWLSEVQMAGAWAIGHAVGATLLKGALVFAAFALAWNGLVGLRLSARVGAIALLGFGTVHMWATLRPQLWTFVCFAALCRILVSDRWRALRWLPGIFAFWVNCHGGWIVGLGVLGVWAAGSVVQRPVDLGRWAILTTACGATTLLNPYGWGLWTFMVRTVHMSRSIAEWNPLWTAPWLNWVPWMVGCATIVWLLSDTPIWPNTRDRARTLLVIVMLAWSSARVMRLESLFVTAVVILTGPYLAARWPSVLRRLNDRDSRLVTAVSPILAAIVAAGAFAVLWRSTSCIPVFGDWAPDSVTARVLDGAAPGRLVTFFDWGEFAIWHFGPRLKISIDGRRETVYTDDVLARHDAIIAGTQLGFSTLEAWRAEYVWLPSTSLATRRWLLVNGYRIDAESERSFVAVRSDLPRLGRIQVPPAAVDCFPQ